MGYLLDHLVRFLIGTVTNTLFDEMIAKVPQLQDFEAVKRVHSQFLSTLCTRGLLLGSRARKPVHACLASATRFARTVGAAVGRIEALEVAGRGAGVEDAVKGLLQSVITIRGEFRRDARSCCSELLLLSHMPRHFYIGELLTQMDFAHYCGSSGEDGAKVPGRGAAGMDESCPFADGLAEEEEDLQMAGSGAPITFDVFGGTRVHTHTHIHAHTHTHKHTVERKPPPPRALRLIKEVVEDKTERETLEKKELRRVGHGPP
eukprot:GHVU01077006.1.p1 GENE.GHVU01077006.1~~GHVU01077006.1.p1  ORF type:complete len:261 (+),score=43.58 GHVU01077006.1:918-1700(+)